MASLLGKSESPARRVSWVGRPSFGSWVVPSLSDLPSCALGFLQRTNSLEEKSRLVSAFRERQSSKNLLSCENSDQGARFRRTETDFSNLFAQGGPSTAPPSCTSFEGLDSHPPEILLLSLLYEPSQNHFSDLCGGTDPLLPYCPGPCCFER